MPHIGSFGISYVALYYVNGLSPSVLQHLRVGLILHHILDHVLRLLTRISFPTGKYREKLDTDRRRCCDESLSNSA